MNFLQRTPFIRLLLALILGITLFQYLKVSLYVLLPFFVTSVITFVLSLFLQKTKFEYSARWLFGVGAMLFFILAGYFLCWNFEKRHLFSDINKRAIFEVELTAVPVEKARSYMCNVNLRQKNDSDGVKPAYGKALIYLQKDSLVPGLSIGDRLLMDAEFKTPDGVQNPNGFDYSKYLSRQGIKATAYVTTDKWEKTGKSAAFSIRKMADKSRKYLLDIFRKFGIAGDEFAVLAALTLGYTDELQPDLMKSYSATGAMHILSVSGLHVGIVYAVMLFLFGFLNKNQRQKIIKAVIITLFLWMYAFITGLSPAVVRAALMFSFVSLGMCFNRKSMIYNSIFGSAFIMLLFNPNLLFNIGFQLSYSAVLSIVFFQPKISKWFVPKNRLLKWGWDLVAVSLAAQLGTAPFVLYYFHQFPNYFLLTNLVAIPLSTLVIYLAIGLLILSFVPYVSLLIAFLLKWSLWLLNFLIIWIQNLPFSISAVSMDYRQLLFSFLAIAFLSAYFYSKKISFLAAGLCSVLIVTGMYSYQRYRTLTTKQFIVFSDSRTPIINFIDNGKNYVFTTDTIHAERVAESFWKSNLLKSPEYIHKNEWFDDGFAVFKNKRILILKDDFLKFKTTSQPLRVDYLILSNKLKPRMKEVLECVTPEMVVADKSLSDWYTNHVKQECDARKIKFYSVAEKGAFVVKFP